MVDLPLQQIGFAYKFGNELGLRVFVQREWLVYLSHMPCLHHHHAVTQRHGFGLVVRDHDGGGADFALNLTQFKLHLFTQLGIQIGQRLVQQQDGGLDHQCAGQSDPLTLPA